MTSMERAFPGRLSRLFSVRPSPRSVGGPTRGGKVANVLVCVVLDESRNFKRVCLSDGSEWVKVIAREIGKSTKEQFAGFDITTQQEVIRSDRLKIPSEDWLLEWIIALRDEYSMLFCHIHFEFVSLDGMRAFLERLIRI
jgi:uncharacterized protein YfaQ (DUF2300 family)